MGSGCPSISWSLGADSGEQLSFGGQVLKRLWFAPLGSLICHHAAISTNVHHTVTKPTTTSQTPRASTCEPPPELHQGGKVWAIANADVLTHSVVGRQDSPTTRPTINNQTSITWLPLMAAASMGKADVQKYCSACRPKFASHQRAQCESATSTDHRPDSTLELRD